MVRATLNKLLVFQHILERKFGTQEVPSLLQIESYLVESSYNLDSVSRVHWDYQFIIFTFRGTIITFPTSLSRHVHLLSNWVPLQSPWPAAPTPPGNSGFLDGRNKLYHLSGIKIEP